MLDSIKIYDTEHTKERVGSKKDGGYVVLNEISKDTQVLLSYGVEDNTSFENDFTHKFGCVAHLFDHTIDGLDPNSDSKRFTFHKEGISHVKTKDCDTLMTHLSKFGNRDHVTLKMDVEWCEWAVFETFPEDYLDFFDQILCEFHLIPMDYKGGHSPYFTKFHSRVYDEINDLLMKRYAGVMHKLQRHFYVFHAHCNNSLPCNVVNGADVPPLLELSLVRKDLVKNPKLATGPWPDPVLDYPNKGDRPDITHLHWNQ
jgi:hypothetical protein